MLSAMIAAKRETAWHETIDGSKVRAGRGGRGKADDDAHVVMQRKVQVKAAKVDVDRRTRGLSVRNQQGDLACAHCRVVKLASNGPPALITTTYVEDLLAGCG